MILVDFSSATKKEILSPLFLSICPQYLYFYLYVIGIANTYDACIVKFHVHINSRVIMRNDEWGKKEKNEYYVDNNRERLSAREKAQLQHRGTYFLDLRHFVTGMDAGGPGTRRRLKLKQSSTRWKETDSGM